MTEPEIAVLVVSCDRYRDLWTPFFHCFFKYWPDCPFRVYLGTNQRVFDHPRVRSIPVGEDRSYAENLRAMLDQVPEPWVIFWVDDRFISAPVETKRVVEAVTRGSQLDAAFLKLIPEAPLGLRDEQGEIGLIPRGTFYRVSMTVALWKKESLAHLLIDGETAWDLEKNGSRRSSRLPEPFFGLSRSCVQRPPIPHVHILVKGRVIRSAISFLEREKLQEHLGARQKQALSSAIYVWLFHKVWACFAPVFDRYTVDRGPSR